MELPLDAHRPQHACRPPPLIPSIAPLPARVFARLPEGHGEWPICAPCRPANTRISPNSRESAKPAERFTVLRKAMELAGDGGDARLMLEAVDEIAARFDVDPLDVKAKVLAGFASDATTSTAIKSFMENSTGVIDQAMGDERFELAVNLGSTAPWTRTRTSWPASATGS